MNRYTFVVLTNPVPGQEEEYNRWYDEQHIPDVLTIPGIIEAKRFQKTPDQSAMGNSLSPFLALYTIETDDLAATLAELQARAGTQAMPLSDTLDTETIFASAYAPLGA